MSEYQATVQPLMKKVDTSSVMEIS